MEGMAFFETLTAFEVPVLADINLLTNEAIKGFLKEFLLIIFLVFVMMHITERFGQYL